MMPRTPDARKAYLEGFHAGAEYLLEIVEDPAIRPLDAADIRAEAERFLGALDGIETLRGWAEEEGCV